MSARTFKPKTLPTMLLPLSGKQRGIISQLAMKSWRRLKDNDLTDESADDYRHREAMECCGKRVSEALQKDFCALASWFANLAGDTKQALYWLSRLPGDEKRQARAKLDQELAKGGKSIAYAAEICQDVCKVTLDRAEPEQLWHLMFTIRMRSTDKAHA